MQRNGPHYKLRAFARRLWWWTRQLLLLLLLGGILLLIWRWQDSHKERIVSQQGDAIHVIDGDSLSIGKGDARRTIRLEGIDAPEYRQPCRDAQNMAWACGKEARAALVALVDKGQLDCGVDATDAYHRAVGICSVAGVADIGREMVRQGMAVSGAETTASRFNDGGPYLVEEAQAERDKRGIWRGKFERPADWRARTKSALP